MGKFRGRMDPFGIRQFQFWQSQLDSVLIRQDQNWRQRAKVFWYKDGDLNSRYFHSLASKRRRNNSLKKLQYSTGCWLSWKDGLGMHI